MLPNGVFMKNKDLVSIIIPTFNRAHLIGETLDSVIAQTYQNWECIVVDDGSTDHTEEVMAEYVAKDARIQFYHRPPEHKPGGNGARNYGFKLSKGDYVQWFDSDDVMLPENLEVKLRLFAENIYFVATSLILWDEGNDRKTNRELDKSEDIYIDYLCNKLQVYTPSILFLKSFLVDKKLFDEELHRGQETEFFLRLFSVVNKENYILINTPTVLYRVHSDSKTALNEAYIPEFRKSMFIIYHDNFKLNLSKGNEKTLRYCYNKINSLFYQSLYNKDKELSKNIVNEFFPLLFSFNYKNAIEINFLSRLFLYSGFSSWRIFQRWKKLNFSF